MNFFFFPPHSPESLRFYQGELIFVANVGDSRAVLATTSDDGELVAVPLTIDFKPNLPREFHFLSLPLYPLPLKSNDRLEVSLCTEEAERIVQCNGRVFCLHDEPGVHRVWLPDEESPGLAMSRAFGDYCVKDFGLISVPEVTQRHITGKDQFVVLATDGVCIYICIKFSLLPFKRWIFYGIFDQTCFFLV